MRFESSLVTNLKINIMSYNGWTDYPTWRIKTDLLDNIEFTEPVTADYMLELA